jgi:hypothetical protein
MSRTQWKCLTSRKSAGIILTSSCLNNHNFGLHSVVLIWNIKSNCCMLSVHCQYLVISPWMSEWTMNSLNSGSCCNSLGLISNFQAKLFGYQEMGTGDGSLDPWISIFFSFSNTCFHTKGLSSQFERFLMSSIIILSANKILTCLVIISRKTFANGCVPLILHVIGNFFCNEDTKRFHSCGEIIVCFQKLKISKLNCISIII